MGLLERARVPVRPGELLLLVGAGGLILGALVAAITDSYLFGALSVIASPAIGVAYLQRRVARRKRRFEEEFPDALTLIGSSLSAGHTFLRSIQLMAEEAEGPIAEELDRQSTHLNSSH